MKYRKKPVVIEAVQWTGNNLEEIIIFMGVGMEAKEDFFFEKEITIRTLEGEMTAQKDDWIIKGVKGEFYPCKPDIFEQTYEPAEDLRNE